jgi:hypothetical protein
MPHKALNRANAPKINVATIMLPNASDAGGVLAYANSIDLVMVVVGFEQVS